MTTSKRTFTEDQTLTAMCLWETATLMLAVDADSQAWTDLHAKLNNLVCDNGSWVMRSALLDLVEECDAAWEADYKRYEKGEGEDPGAFDWDHVPAFLEGCLITDRLEQAIAKQGITQ